jgi:hypothetical protein
MERRNPAERGMSLYAGAVGTHGVPVGCRAVALTASPDLSKATLYVPMATSRELLAGVAATKRIAVVATYPPDHGTVQLKGLAGGVRLAEEGERELIRDRIDGFAEVLHRLGYPLRIVRAVNHWPAFAIDMTIDELYEQTPGPNAGMPLR